MSSPAKSSLFHYLEDEKSISKRVGTAVPPLRVFTLRSLGLNTRQFLAYMCPTFSVLHMDPYDAKNKKIAFLKERCPEAGERLNHFLGEYYANHEDLDSILDLIVRLTPKDLYEFDRIGLTGRRKRSIAKFILLLLPDRQWKISRVPASAFKQNVGKNDTRSFTRVFDEAPEFVTEYPPMHHLMRCLACMVGELRPDARVLEMNLHQMFVFADLMSNGENAPEGIHQDGSDYIVSALVMERASIIGGESIVYGPDKQTEYLRRTLSEGEGIFQADKGSSLWHYVTPIEEDDRQTVKYGHRSILGFDINIVQ